VARIAVLDKEYSRESARAAKARRDAELRGEAPAAPRVRYQLPLFAAA